jgi:hypothetical protein
MYNNKAIVRLSKAAFVPHFAFETLYRWCFDQNYFEEMICQGYDFSNRLFPHYVLYFYFMTHIATKFIILIIARYFYTRLSIGGMIVFQRNPGNFVENLLNVRIPEMRRLNTMSHIKK